jgi:hypothetical protein
MSSLAPQFQRLVELVRHVGFGRIEGLLVRDGVPVLDPPPVVVREYKFGSDDGSRIESNADDFLLKSQVVELVQHIARIGNGVIDCIEVKHGLPFRMVVKEAAA